MKILLTSIILICTANVIYSQTVSIDENFGENGIVTTPNYGVELLTFDRQGNIFALGYASFGFPAVLKTNANGIIDQHFGTNGMVILNEYGSNWGKRYGIKITNDNKIVIVFLVYTHGAVGPSDPPKFLIMRFNHDGSVDKSFGINGEITLGHSVDAVNTENDDFMLIVHGHAYYDDNGYNQDTYVSKYNYNGELDESFGVNGRAYLTGNQMRKFGVESIKILKDQSIIVAGYDSSLSLSTKLAFCKLNPNGSFVANFANNGIFSGDININNNGDPKSLINIIEDGDENLFFTGRHNERDVSGNITRRYFICNFNANGTFNSNFGKNGIFYFSDVWSNSKETVLQSGNRFLIGKDRKITSINSNGTLDTYFHDNGSFVFKDFSINDMKQQNSNELIVAGREGIVKLNIHNETSIKPNEISSSLLIFPNPVKDELRIEWKIGGSHSGKMRINSVEIIDLSGKTIVNCKSTIVNQINVSTLPKGIYFIKIKTDKNIVIKKFIKG